MDEADARKLAGQITARIGSRLVELLMKQPHPSEEGKQIVIHFSPGRRQVRIQWPPLIERLDV